MDNEILRTMNEGLILVRPLWGKDLRLIRSIMGLNQTEFSELLGYSHDHISRIEKETKKPIPKKVIQALYDKVISIDEWEYKKDLIMSIEKKIWAESKT